MPKKTRHSKVEAQLKRLQKQQAVIETTAEQSTDTKQAAITISTNLKSLETSSQTLSTPQTTTVANYSHVYKDLRKTLIFASVSVIFQIILSRVV